jgi:hypothetical protein
MSQTFNEIDTSGMSQSNKVIGNPNAVYFVNYELTRSEMLKEKL